MKTIRALFLAAAATALCVLAPAACAPLPSGPAGTAARPQRIVSLAPNVTEMLFAIGAGPQVVGVTDFCDYPEAARRLPKVGGFVNPNPEAIIALAPDLVIATPNVGNQPFVERVMRLGARVEIVEARDLDGIYPAIETLGRLTGREPQAMRLLADLREEVTRAANEALSHRPVRTLLCIQIEPLIAAGPGSYPHDVLTLAGGESIVPGSAGEYPNLSLEQVVAAAPEVIIQTQMDTRAGGDPSAPLLQFWSRWPSIPAVGSKRVHVVPGDALLRPGPRLPEGIALLASLLDTRGGVAQ